MRASKHQEVQIFSCNKRTSIVLLVLIIILAFSVRIWQIDYDLPYIYHPDEPIFYLSVAHYLYTNNFRNLSLDALPSGIPINSFVAVVNALAYYPYNALRLALSDTNVNPNITLPDIIEMGVVKTATPNVVLMGRLISALVGTFSVYIVFIIVFRLSGSNWAGLVSALLLAISPTHVLHSRFITPDIYVTFFILLTIYFSILIGQKNNIKYYIFTGISLGCVVSSKANGVLIVILIFSIIYFAHGIKGLLNRKFIILLVIALTIFVLTTPFIFENYSGVIGSFIDEGQHYSTGHPGMEGETLFFYANHLFKVTSIFLIFSLAGIVISFVQKFYFEKSIAVFIILYFLFINQFTVRNDRTILPIIPLVIIMSILFFIYLHNNWEKIFKHSGSIGSSLLIKRAIIGIIVFSGVIHISYQLYNQMHFEVSKGYVLTTARLWIEEYIPKESKIMLESYTPYLERGDYQLFATRRMINQTSRWYREQNFEYLIFSQRMFGRFFNKPEIYHEQIIAYQSLFDDFDLIKVFESPSHQIRIYKIK